jgi:glycine cleavage system H protein
MIPDNLRYYKEHEWVRVEGKQAVIGISDHAQEVLGDIVFFQLPPIGAKVKAGQEISEVESTKATSSVYTPISGTVSKVNVALNEKPELANKDPYGEGWVAVIEMDNPAEVNGLMDAKAYAAYLDKEAK